MDRNGQMQSGNGRDRCEIERKGKERKGKERKGTGEAGDTETDPDMKSDGARPEDRIRI